jgi:hypothetical protein
VLNDLVGNIRSEPPPRLAAATGRLAGKEAQIPEW